MLKEDLRLPEHVEQRRIEILSALHLRSKQIAQRHAAVLEMITAMNDAIASFNRVLDHCDGWAIEAMSVIDCDIINTGGDAFLSTPEGQAVAQWRKEIDASHFNRVPLTAFVPMPELPQADEFNAIPRYPDRPKR